MSEKALEEVCVEKVARVKRVDCMQPGFKINGQDAPYLAFPFMKTKRLNVLFDSGEKILLTFNNQPIKSF